jgi:shikimate dehydrogenase
VNCFGLIGHPLGHSFSKAYFTEKFSREKIDACYENFDIENLAQFLSSLRGAIATKQSIRGFNITIPYKEAIIPYLNEIDETAKEIGAVNTVKVMENGKLKGFNTDILGIEATLFGTEATNTSLRGATATKQSTCRRTSNYRRTCGLPRSLTLARNDDGLNALILGTGGASKAVQYVLKKHHLTYHLVSRDPNKGHFTYETLSPEIIKEHLLIINATPVGMAPNNNESPAIPYEAITSQHILFDLIYNPEETQFLRNGKAKGAQTINGLTMLYAQAKASWEIWNL